VPTREICSFRRVVAGPFGGVERNIESRCTRNRLGEAAIDASEAVAGFERTLDLHVKVAAAVPAVFTTRSKRLRVSKELIW